MTAPPCAFFALGGRGCVVDGHCRCGSCGSVFCGACTPPLVMYYLSSVAGSASTGFAVREFSSFVGSPSCSPARVRLRRDPQRPPCGRRPPWSVRLHEPRATPHGAAHWNPSARQSRSRPYHVGVERSMGYTSRPAACSDQPWTSFSRPPPSTAPPNQSPKTTRPPPAGPIPCVTLPPNCAPTAPSAPRPPHQRPERSLP